MTAQHIKNFTAEEALSAKSWPFQEAKNLIKRLDKLKKDGPVVFETGYGPSGPPHIGTFGEVARTTMVRRAFELLTGRETRLISISDDMDGMRKVPPQLPNQELLTDFLQKPLTDVPDPWGTHQSFAHHNNAKLRDFLDQFGFDYEFKSSTDCYRSGEFDSTLIRVLECYDAVMDIILPTLGGERRASYSPILPISPSTSRVFMCLCSKSMPKREKSYSRTRMAQKSGRASAAETPNFSGKLTGPDDGSRSALTMKCLAKT